MVVYTTSLRGVRKTFEDCNRVHRVVFNERDVSLHKEFLREVKELVGEAVALPQVFVKGRYVGGFGGVGGVEQELFGLWWELLDYCGWG